MVEIVFGWFAILSIVVFMVYINNKDRKELLTVRVNDDIVEFYLSDDEYLRFKPSTTDTKNEIREVIKKRAFELKELVDKIVLYPKRDDNFEKELIKLIS